MVLYFAFLSRLHKSLFSNNSLTTLALLILACFCATPSAAQVISTDYTVGVGDELFITVWGREEMSGAVKVGPDGTIALPYPVGSLKVIGLTSEKISELVTEKLEDIYRNPRVTVSIRAFEGFYVHIIGQVKAPSFYKVPDNTTLQEVITLAKGVTELANLKNILLKRTEDGNTTEKTIDFSLFIKENDLSKNPILQADDVIFIPRLSREEYAKSVVTVLGEVGKPGVHELENPMPLLDVLALAGGVREMADISSVWLLDDSTGKGAPIQIALQDYLIGLNPNANPMVKQGATVYVKSARLPEEPTFSVNVVGQVKRPGMYQVREKTRLLDAIFVAGGFAEGAQIGKVNIIHTQSKSKRFDEINVKSYLLEGDAQNNPLLSEGDTNMVPLREDAKRIPTFHTVFATSISINIIGEVRRPETYQLSSAATLLDALTIAGGPTADANLELTILIRGTPEGKQTRIEVDLDKVLTEGQFDLLPPIQQGDTIFVPKKGDVSLWRQVVRLAADLSTVAVTILVLTGRR